MLKNFNKCMTWAVKGLIHSDYFSWRKPKQNWQISPAMPMQNANSICLTPLDPCRQPIHNYISEAGQCRTCTYMKDDRMQAAKSASAAQIYINALHDNASEGQLYHYTPIVCQRDIWLLPVFVVEIILRHCKHGKCLRSRAWILWNGGQPAVRPLVELMESTPIER